MITEDYVSFDTAKLLKEKGFDEECWEYYDNNKNFKSFRITKCSYDNIPYKDAYIAPTHQMAMKWLRENHKIHIDIDYIDFLEHGEVWSAKIVDMVTFKETKIENTWNNYEEMANEAIEFCLKNLVK